MMRKSIFKTKLNLDESPNNGEWILGKPLVYETRKGIIIEAPKGFVTDLASIPRIFQILIPKAGKHRSPAVIHDLLYVKKGRLGLKKFTREEADELFLEAMEDVGVSYWKRYSMYWAVRAAVWRTSWD